MIDEKLSEFVKLMKSTHPDLREYEIVDFIVKNWNRNYEEIALMLSWKNIVDEEIYIEKKITKKDEKKIDDVMQSIYNYSEEVKNRKDLRMNDKEKYLQEYVIDELNIIDTEYFINLFDIEISFEIKQNWYIYVSFIEDEENITFEEGLKEILKKINWWQIKLTKENFLYLYKDVLLILNKVFFIKNQKFVLLKVKKEFDITYTMNYGF